VLQPVPERQRGAGGCCNGLRCRIVRLPSPEPRRVSGAWLRGQREMALALPNACRAVAAAGGPERLDRGWLFGDLAGVGGATIGGFSSSDGKTGPNLGGRVESFALRWVATW
jgi:hypothetical protein